MLAPRLPALQLAGQSSVYRSVRLRMSLFLETLSESLQVVGVNIGNGPIVEIGINPVQELITLPRYCLGSFRRVRLCRPYKQINKMLPPLIDQRRHRSVIEIVKTAADQRKSLLRKVNYARGEIELRVQPRCYRVLIGRRDIGEMVCHERTHMTGDELRC